MQQATIQLWSRVIRTAREQHAKWGFSLTRLSEEVLPTTERLTALVLEGSPMWIGADKLGKRTLGKFLHSTIATTPHKRLMLWTALQPGGGSLIGLGFLTRPKLLPLWAAKGREGSEIINVKANAS